RSVAMMTQRPTMGSRRSSGICDLELDPRGEGAPGRERLAEERHQDGALVGALEPALGLRRGLEREAPERRLGGDAQGEVEPEPIVAQGKRPGARKLGAAGGAVLRGVEEERQLGREQRLGRAVGLDLVLDHELAAVDAVALLELDGPAVRLALARQ